MWCSSPARAHVPAAGWRRTPLSQAGRGIRVLPIGGLKEKILAAKMAHIEKVLVPEKNRPDMAELSKEITRGLQIVYVRQMEDVLKEALV